MTTSIEDLSPAACVAHLAAATVGRIAVIHDGYPVVFPVNFRTIALDSCLALAFRTRPGSIIDQPHTHVSFQIDGVDDAQETGWSVLVRGDLVESPEWARTDSHPLVAEGRDRWLILVPTDVSGRRVTTTHAEWTFDLHGYL